MKVNMIIEVIIYKHSLFIILIYTNICIIYINIKKSNVTHKH